MARSLASVGRRVENGFVRSYALFMLAGAVVIFAYLLLR
jgi:hypothetical protein